MKLIDLNLYMHHEFSKPEEVLEKHKTSSGFASHLKNKAEIKFVKHLNYKGHIIHEGIYYRFFKSLNKFWYIPLKTYLYIKRQKPDVVLVQGLIFPIQIIFLRFLLGKNVVITAQHHGEKPYSGIKGWFQKKADRCVNLYFFTSSHIAIEWIDNNIISCSSKCVEVLEASTYFKPYNKDLSKKRLGLTGTDNFLWVGRLNNNKDPLTVLMAFKNYLLFNEKARLYMVFHTEELKEEVESFINDNQLQQHIILIGKIKSGELPFWYSAADFFISGSHAESCGFALLEAMACGCIPIVTDIPSFNKITFGNEYGLLYEPGNPISLLQILSQLEDISNNNFSVKVQHHFNEKLSFRNIAESIYNHCEPLVIK
jgi:glycosyltransferase involved in cell wall biosynthesis